MFENYPSGMDTMMNGYGQPQGYRAGGGVQMPGGHMPSGGANLGNRGYPGAVGQGGYPHQSAGAHQAHLSHQQKELLKEQERRKRKAIAQQQQMAAKKQEFPSDLFDAPVKIAEPATPGINADKVLGNFTDFKNNHNYSNFVGVDYQPPTPAPVQQNDDDDEEKPPRKLPSMGRPPQNATRLPSNMENPRPTNKPRPSAVQQPPPPWNSAAAAAGGGLSTPMAPPSMAPPPSRMNGGMNASTYRPPPPQQSSLIGSNLGNGGVASNPISSAPTPGSGRISVPPSSNGLNRMHRPPKLALSSMRGSDDPLDHILGVMTDLPTPLGAIVTPQVEKTEDRGAQQHQPRYFGMSNSMFGDSLSGSGPGPALLSRLSESDSDKETGVNDDVKGSPPLDSAPALIDSPDNDNAASPLPGLKPPPGPGETPALLPRMSDSSSSESSSDSEESGQEEAESEEDVSRRPGSGVGSGRSPGLAATGKLGSSSVLSGGSATMEKSNLSEEESDDDQHRTRDYNLAVFINKAHDRTPPTTSSTHSNNTLEPSPRNTYAPTPSPGQSSFAANPSPRNQLIGNAGGSGGTLSGVGHLTSPRTLGTSPRSSFMPGLSSVILCGSPRNPTGPGANSRHSVMSPLKNEITDPISDIITDIPPVLAPLSSDDDEPPPVVEKRSKKSASPSSQKQLKTKASSKSYNRRSTPAEKKASSPVESAPPPAKNRYTNNNKNKHSRKRKHESSAPSNLVKKHNLDDSDDDGSDSSDIAPPPPAKKKAPSERSRGSSSGRVTRAASASPMKGKKDMESGNSSSAGRTPSPRKPSSGRSTPSSTRRTPNARSKPVSQPDLTESDDDEIDSPPPTTQKVNSGGGNQKKNPVLFSIFGRKAVKSKKEGGGKGKGGKGKGGIDVNFVGESDEEERKRGSSQSLAQTPSSPPPEPSPKRTTTSSISNHHTSNSTGSHIPPANIKQEPLDSLSASDHHLDPLMEADSAVDLGGRSVVSDTVDQDLALSEEDDDMPLPPSSSGRRGTVNASPLPSHHMQSASSRLIAQRPLVAQQIVVTRKSNGRPSLVCSVPLSRLSRSFGDPRISSHSQHKDRQRSGGDIGWPGRPCDNNYSDNSMVGRHAHSERIDGTGSSRIELPERPASARSASRERRPSSGSGSWRNSGGSSEHRKAQERTISQFAPPSSDEYPNHASNSQQLSTSCSGESAVDGLMPPPRGNGYVHDRRGYDMLLAPPPPAEEDIEAGMNEACRLKREADNEENVEAKCTKYLKACLMFCHSAMKTEKEGDHHNAFQIYNQTLRMIKCVLKPIIPKRQAWPPKEPTDIRLLVMSLRAQSLLNLKMYKLNRHVLKDLQKQINEVLVKSNNDEETQQGGEHGVHLSPTPSPAGSEGSNCSKSSGYTSSGEKEMTLSVPKATLQNQYNIASYLSQCHELWEQAELFLTKGNCEGFFRSLDEECGPLTLHSDLCKLTNYTKRGLDWISQEYSSLRPSPSHRNS